MPPGVVVVSGLPAAGKSTLAKKIADGLGFVHVCKDDMRRPLRPVLTSEPTQGVMAAAMSGLCNVVIGAVLDAGQGCVIDANFNMPERGAPIRDFIVARHVTAFEVCLWGDPAVLRARFIARADPALTPELEDYLEVCLHRERLPVLGPPARTVEFDTTDFSPLTEALPALVDQIASALSPGTPPRDRRLRFPGN